MKNKISTPFRETRNHTFLFPKVNIYREMDPKYIPLLNGQNPLGYGDDMQEPISIFLKELKDENGGSLPKIDFIGSYSETTGRCLISFINQGDFSREYFTKK